jgi:outer membrane biogenesis lipoprotein LolB
MKSTLKIALFAISFAFLTACGGTTETTTTETPAETTTTETTAPTETPAVQDSTTTGDSAKVNQ